MCMFVLFTAHTKKRSQTRISHGRKIHNHSAKHAQKTAHTHTRRWQTRGERERKMEKSNSYYTITHTINSVVIYQFNIYILPRCTLTSNTWSSTFLGRFYENAMQNGATKVHWRWCVCCCSHTNASTTRTKISRNDSNGCGHTIVFVCCVMVKIKTSAWITEENSSTTLLHIHYLPIQVVVYIRIKCELNVNGILRATRENPYKYERIHEHTHARRQRVRCAGRMGNQIANENKNVRSRKLFHVPSNGQHKGIKCGECDKNYR